METNMKIGMFLNTDHTITEESNQNSYAVVFNPSEHLAVLAAKFEDDCFAALEAHMLETAQNSGMNVIIPSDKQLLSLAEVRKLVKPALKKLGVDLPKGQLWSKTLHDDCSYFTVDLKKSCVHHAMPEEERPMLLMVKY